MDIIQTCETIELWINSCKTVEQLELLDEVLYIFINTSRFPDEKYNVIVATRETMEDKIKYRKEFLLNEVQPVRTDEPQ